MVRICIRLLLASVLVLPAVLAQSMTGTLTGIVMDSSGAIVPNADVVVVNEQSGDIRKTLTNEGGYFTISSLPAATYKLVVEFTGFAKWERTGIVFNGGDKRNVTVALSIAASTEAVQVVASAGALAPVDTGEKAALITSAELQNLSIEGRNAAELVRILPGAAFAGNKGQNRASYTGEVIGINGAGIGGNQGGLGGVNINGSTIDISQDGAHSYDPGAPGSATPVNPNIEMVQEVKVLTSNFSAENSKGPVVMNTVSKSGGRDFHGEGYLYARNSVLNAADWENNNSGTSKPDSKYYYPGGNLSGPVILPGTSFNKNRDKLFFFQGFEYYKQTIDSGVMRAFVPTDAMRAGDFSAANTYGHLQGNLASTTNFGGGKVPASQIDAGGQVLLNLYPKANADPLTHNGYNYINTLLVDQNSWQSLTRLDYSLSDNTKLFVRYNVQSEVQNQPTGLWQGRAADNMVPYPTNIVGNNRSDSIAGSLTHVFSPSMTSETTFGYTYVDFPNSPEDPSKLLRSNAKYPYKGVFGTSQTLPVVQSWDGGLPALGAAGYSFNPKMLAAKGILSIGENFAKVINTHTAKFGMYYEQLYNKQNDWSTSEGVFTYFSWFSPTGNNYADILTGQGFFNYQETTLNPPSNIGQRVLDFYAQDSWKIKPRLTLEYGIRFQHMPTAWDRNGVGFAIFDASKYNNDPSAVDQKTGLSYHKLNSSIPLSGTTSRTLFFSPRLGLAWDIFGTGKTVVRGGWGKFRSFDGLNDGIFTGPAGTGVGGLGYACTGGCPNMSGLDAVVVTPSTGRSSINVYNPKDDEQPLTTSYSFTVSQFLPKAFVFEAAYVGNHSDYLKTTADINYVPIGAMSADPGGNQDDYRLRRNYQAITQSMHNFISDYNALQLGFTRNTGFLTLQSNYTWSKLTGTRGTAVTLPNLGIDYMHGIMPNNRTHVFNVAYTVELPQFAKSNAFAKQLANGWQISGITQVQSGADVINATATNFNVPGAALDLLGSPSGSVFPTLLCDPKKNLNANQYLNGACFGPAPHGTTGTAATPYWPGPAYLSNDLSLFKNFKIREKQTLQFRMSAFNFLNHPLWSFRQNDQNLNLTFDSNGQMNNTRFGYTDYKYGHRSIQLALKYLF